MKEGIASPAVFNGENARPQGRVKCVHTVIWFQHSIVIFLHNAFQNQHMSWNYVAFLAQRIAVHSTNISEPESPLA